MLLLTAPVSASQDGSATPDPVKQALQDEKDKADLRATIAKDNQSIAESNAAAAKATVGSISTDKLPQGNITADQKMAVEGTILAYRSAADSAVRIADSIAPVDNNKSRTCPSKITFYSAKEYNDVWAISTLTNQLDIVIKQAAPLSGPLPYLQENALIRGLRFPWFLRQSMPPSA